MPIRVDCSKIPSRNGVFSRRVVTAVATAYAGLAHGRPDLDVTGVRDDQPIAAQVDALVGTAKDDHSIVFDQHDVPSNVGVGSARLYDALAVIYAWREFCWDDIEAEDTGRGFEADEAISDRIDGLAAGFGIDPVDYSTRADSDRRGFIAVADASPKPRF